MVRRRLEGLWFAAWLFILVPLALFALASGRPGVGGHLRSTLRRWRVLLLGGFKLFRERWWIQLRLEKPAHLWRYLFLSEIAAIANAASGPSGKNGKPADKLLVVQPGHMGDMLHTTPMLRALRSHRPAATIHLVTGPWNRAIAERIPYVDAVECYTPRWDSFTRGDDRLSPGFLKELSFFRRQRAERYDVMIHCLTGCVPGMCHYLFAAPGVRIGNDTIPDNLYEAPGDYRPVEFVSHQYEAERILKLLAGLGFEDEDASLEFPVEEADRASACKVLQREGLEGGARYAVLSPGAGWPGKQWPLERFTDVAKHLLEKHDIAPVITGAASELPLARQVAGPLGRRAIVLAGKTSVTELAAVLESAAVFIGNDSGPYHLAAAVGAPVVGLFGPGFPVKWAAKGPRARTIWHETDCTCFPWHPRSVCDHDGRCMKAISAAEVCEAIDGLLEGSRVTHE